MCPVKPLLVSVWVLPAFLDGWTLQGAENMLKAPASGVVGERRGDSVFPPLRAAFREQLMQDELMEEEQDASVGAGTARGSHPGAQCLAFPAQPVLDSSGGFVLAPWTAWRQVLQWRGVWGRSRAVLTHTDMPCPICGGRKR